MTPERLDRIEMLLERMAERQDASEQQHAADHRRAMAELQETRAIADSNARAIQAWSQYFDARIEDERNETINVELDLRSELRETRQDMVALRSAMNSLTRAIVSLAQDIGRLWQRDQAS